MEYLRQPIKGYEGLYEIDNLGEVYSNMSLKKFKRVIQLKQRRDGSGYPMVNLLNNRTRIHRLIAIQFIPNPNNYPFVNHINGIKHDNRIENLEWCTCAMNNKHAKDTGLNNARGEVHGMSKLKEKEVLEILKIKAEFNYSNPEIAKMFNVSTSTIWRVVNKALWTHV